MLSLAATPDKFLTHRNILPGKSRWRSLLLIASDRLISKPTLKLHPAERPSKSGSEVAC